eukprot:3575477-Alexandrium_andersonii.AAC.1
MGEPLSYFRAGAWTCGPMGAAGIRCTLQVRMSPWCPLQRSPLIRNAICLDLHAAPPPIGLLEWPPLKFATGHGGGV